MGNTDYNIFIKVENLVRYLYFLNISFFYFVFNEQLTEVVNVIFSGNVIKFFVFVIEKSKIILIKEKKKNKNFSYLLNL